MQKKKTDRKERNSSIELLKIGAIFLIVLSHVLQTLSSGNPYISYQGYVVDLSASTRDVQQFILLLLRYAGMFGNTLFFVCSAWFLVDSKRFSAKKWFAMLTEVWVISMLILGAVWIDRRGDIDPTLRKQCLLPTTYSLNWYMTCYLLFYPIHPFLNMILHKMEKKQLLGASLAMMALYCVADFLKPGLFFSTKLVLWIALYFLIAYMKLYMPKTVAGWGTNVRLLLLGLFGHIGFLLFINFRGLRDPLYAHRLMAWCVNNNPFLILMAIALFHLARNREFTSRMINRISGLSLVVYLIHENLLLRTYYRPYAVNYIYEHFGYDHVVLWMLLLSVLIFAAALIVGAVYRLLFGKIVNALSALLHTVCKWFWEKTQKLLFRLE